MNQTNPKKLRAEMKDYLEMAQKEPIRIQRRAGGSFILINEDQFEEMQNEILSLQRRLLGATEAISGKTKAYQLGDRSRLKRFAKR